MTDKIIEAPATPSFVAYVLGKVTDAIGGCIAELRVRAATHSFRLNLLEERLLHVGAQRAKAGERGPTGPPGPLGPMPRHKWTGTKLAFEQGPDGGKFGEAVDLQGPPGKRSGLTASGMPIGGGGGTAAPVNSWFPSGW